LIVVFSEGAALRKLILKMSVSIDGFVGGPNGEIDRRFTTMDDEATAWTVETLWQARVHIMGGRRFHVWRPTGRRRRSHSPLP
jgi:hypothetical protein